jgi:hypothetical protein
MVIKISGDTVRFNLYSFITGFGFRNFATGLIVSGVKAARGTKTGGPVFYIFDGSIGCFDPVDTFECISG